MAGSPRCRRRTPRTGRSRSSARRTPIVRGSRPRARCSTPPRCGSRCSTSRGRPRPRLCIRSGYLALREVAGFFGFDYDDSPAPDDPISVPRDEFDEVYDEARRSGRPGAGPTATRPGATSPGWRVNYDRVLDHARRASSWRRTRRGCPIGRPSCRLRHYGWGRRRIEISRRSQRSPAPAVAQRSSKSQVSRESRRVAADEPLRAERHPERLGRQRQEERVGRDLTRVRGHRRPLAVDELGDVDALW